MIIIEYDVNHHQCWRRTVQEKAEAAMLDKIYSNQSVVLVSHAMGQIRQLCNRVLWLDNGTTKMLDEPAVVIKECEKSLGQKKTNA